MVYTSAMYLYTVCAHVMPALQIRGKFLGSWFSIMNGNDLYLLARQVQDLERFVAVVFDGEYINPIVKLFPGS